MKKILKGIYTTSAICMLIFAMTACESDETVNESGNTVVIETGKKDDKETEQNIETEKDTESTAVEETKPFFEETNADSNVTLPEEIDMMRPILLGLCKSMSGGNAYNPADPGFFWNSIYDAINGGNWLHPHIALSEDGSGYVVPKEVMSEYAEAMFAGNSSLVEIPQTLGGIEFNVDLDSYILYSSEGYTGTMDFTSVEQTADGYIIGTAFTTRNGNVEDHTFILTSGGTGAFPCAVTRVE